jgi:O-antigen ligase
MRIIKDTPNEQFRLFNYLFLLLGASLFIPLFLSGAPIDQQFWGTFGRNNGFLTTLALFLIFLFSSLLVGTTGFYDYILRSFKLTGLILLIYGLAQFFNMDPFPWSNSEIFGTLGNVNFFSAFIGMSCIFYIYAFFTEKKKIARLKSIILFSVALFLIIKTNSTQGLFILIVSGSLLLIMLGANLNRRIRYLMILLWLIGVIVGIIGVFNKGPASQFIYQQSTSYRYDYWLAGLRMFFDNFLTGVGLDSYGDFYRMYRDQIAIDKTGPSRMANSAHNGLIDLAATSGFFGLVLTLSVYGFIIYRFIAAVRINKFTELDCLFF